MAIIKKLNSEFSIVAIHIRTELLNRLYLDKQEPQEDEPNLDEMLELEIRKTLNITGGCKRL